MEYKSARHKSTPVNTQRANSLRSCQHHAVRVTLATVFAPPTKQRPTTHHHHDNNNKQQQATSNRQQQLSFKLSLWILTAISIPSLVLARCTCPKDAAAKGLSSNSAKSSPWISRESRCARMWGIFRRICPIIHTFLGSRRLLFCYYLLRLVQHLTVYSDLQQCVWCFTLRTLRMLHHHAALKKVSRYVSNVV